MIGFESGNGFSRTGVLSDHVRLHSPHFYRPISFVQRLGGSHVYHVVRTLVSLAPST